MAAPDGGQYASMPLRQETAPQEESQATRFQSAPPKFPVYGEQAKEASPPEEAGEQRKEATRANAPGGEQAKEASPPEVSWRREQAKEASPPEEAGAVERTKPSVTPPPAYCPRPLKGST
ncbi:hypothetical protein T484DRAFT_1843539 [Baffinella frigidus]|nr:hypothetical protein T484DRAFT_1843539 [Cryptophyta sp. CCMP2293]